MLGAVRPRFGFWRVVWAAPCSAAGVLLGLLLWPFGARWQRVGGVLELAVRNRPLPRHWAATLPFSAITLGHVVVGISPQELQRLRRHERVHVAQYERWGVAFWVAYPLASLWQLPFGRRPYWDNPFEVQARRFEQRADGRTKLSISRPGLGPGSVP